jgi:hypothetical protein
MYIVIKTMGPWGDDEKKNLMRLFRKYTTLQMNQDQQINFLFDPKNKYCSTMG